MEVVVKNQFNHDVILNHELKHPARVPGYFITPEGYFIRVPDNMYHTEFFFKIISLYQECSRHSIVLTNLMATITNNIKGAIYIGSVPGMREVYVEGKLYMPSQELCSDKLYETARDFIENAEMPIKAYKLPLDTKKIDSNYVEEEIDLNNYKAKVKKISQ